jgi:Archaea-specific RecJ-like exonuclease, contains DnaJ-type Zn finger domain
MIFAIFIDIKKGECMYRTLLLTGLSVLFLLSSCARNEQRAPAYSATKCPFCVIHPGTCTYCNGTGKCAYCNGTGKRQVVWPNIPEESIKKGSYDEQCSFCKGTGTCHYCVGKAKCWACKGTGTVHSWDFYDECKGEKK